MGNYTDESSSPAKLLTSTIGDELKIATRNRALVYAISPFRDAAILSAGHAGTGAFWLNERTGKWCSTTYYNEFPWWLSQYNDRQAVDLRIKDMVWEPLFPIERYRYLPEWRDIAFKYKLEGYRENKYVRFNAGPLANDEVNRITEELLSKSTVGHDSIPDLLSLTYYAGNYNHRPTVECAMEIQDAYARLDRQIAALLDILDKKVGLKRVLFCLASTGYTEPEAPDAALYRIPGGEFHMNRCTTLLNMFLMATYGEGRYVEAYYDNEIYLNHKLIENKQLNLTEIQERAADFLAQFSGVGSVYTAHRLMLGAWSPRQELARNAYHPKHSGDLQINVLPGRTIVKENGGSNRVVRSAHIPTPLILMGGGIRPEIVRTPVDILRVAPTLAGAIHIRAPNACDVAPID